MEASIVGDQKEPTQNSPSPQPNAFPTPPRVWGPSRDERSALCGPPGRGRGGVLGARGFEEHGEPHSGHHRFFYILASAVAIGVIGLAVLFLFDPARHAFYPVCALYRTTGLLCPGCGSLRAMHQLLHGNVAAALHFNLLLVSSIPLWLWLGIRFLVLKLRNQPATISIRAVWLWGGLSLIVAFGILRNLPFAQATWLAP